MTVPDDPRLLAARALPMAEVVDRLGIQGLRPTGTELVGPCPLCGGRDRFAINLLKQVFNCRQCDLRGKGQIDLVKGVLGIEFKESLQWLCGDRPAQVDQAALDRRRRIAAAADQKQQAAQEKYRRWAITDARRIWGQARPGRLGVVGAYLAARGLTRDLIGDVPDALRFIVDHPYAKTLEGQSRIVHRGPCMIAGILSPAGDIIAVHQTWVDPNPPHGKAKIMWRGKTLPSKLVRGSKKGGAIQLYTPQGADTLIMGEGIETTLSALAARRFPRAAYWAGIDLGNMAGRMQRVAGLRYSRVPDMDDHHAFVPPPWVERLIFVMDGDSAPAMTRAKLESGLRRAMAARPGLQGQIIPMGGGIDLNDVLMNAARDLPPDVSLGGGP